MTDVGVVADAVRPPAVVGVTDEVVVVTQGDAQTAVVVGQPVFAAGVVNEDEFDGRDKLVTTDIITCTLRARIPVKIITGCINC